MVSINAVKLISFAAPSTELPAAAVPAQVMKIVGDAHEELSLGRQ